LFYRKICLYVLATAFSQVVAKIATIIQARPMHAPSNRRKEPRIPVIKPALITVNTAEKAIECKVIDLSKGGACLWLENIDELPDEFDIFYDSTARRCHVRWRTNNIIGVAFD
jgi:hypothetical protein